MKINKKIAQIFTASAAMLILTGAMSIKAEAKTNNIMVSAPSGKIVRVAKGKKVKLKIVVKKLKDKKVTFKSNNPKIAKVSASGTVKGIKSGKTKITVAAKSNPKIKTVIKVVVYKKAVKKISLNKNNVSLKKGEEFLLTASVKPAKKASKVLKYTSSDKSIATVTKKGKIKACGVGSAVITVESTDGSKKQAKCKVSVVDSNNSKINKVSIKNFSVRRSDAYNVELSEKCALDYDDFKVTYKYLKNSKTVVDNEIVSVNTNDNIHYEVTVEDDVQFNSYVQIEIKKIGGLNKKEIFIDKKYLPYSVNRDTYDIYQEKYVGDELCYNIEDIAAVFTLTYPLKINYSNLPRGINASGYVIEGKCNSILKDHIAKATIEDAKGKKACINIHLLVGDKDTIIVKAFDKTVLAYKHGENQYGKNIRGEDTYTPSVIFAGGEGVEDLRDLKDYTAVGLPDNVNIDSSGRIMVIDKTKDVKPGVYNITINALTPTDKSITMSYKLTLVEGITIKGKLMDTLGRGFNDIQISFSSAGNDSGVSCEKSVITDKNGNYEIRLIPLKYNIYADDANIITSRYSKTILYYSTENSLIKSQTYNLKSNYYKTIFKIPFIENRDLGFFRTNLVVKDSKGYNHYVDYTEDTDYIHEIDGVSMARINCVYAYLRKGSYSIEEESGYALYLKYENNNTQYYKMDPLKFTVNGSKTSIVLNMTEVKF